MSVKNLTSRHVYTYIATLFIFTFCTYNQSFGHPGGTPHYVTDAAPFCADCHSACSKEMLENMPEAVRESQFYTSKHYSQIENGEFEYEKMSVEDRKTLLADVIKVDENASIQILAPSEIKQGGTATVTIYVKGGSGPVIGVMLLDDGLWWQSRPIAASGWEIVEEPKIVDSSGKPQTTFLSKRAEGLKKNINYVNIYGINTNIEKDIWQESKVVYTLIPPREKGEYKIAAAFLYGTEKASKVGFTQTLRGKLPKGGNEGHSGRVMFSRVATVTVN